jgi:MFS family permease
MTTTSVTQAGPARPGAARVLAASLAGTAVEYYDFFIYGTAASLVLGPLFFPKSSPTAQQMSAYATFAVAFVARPVGAAFFGHFGDRIGRKSTLVAALLTMGLCTVLIGLLPGYAVWGWAAPALLCLLRFGQGLGLGGEWGGAALLAVENAPDGWRGRFGMFPMLGTPLGQLASTIVFLVMGALVTPDEFKAWGWRIPFLLSAVLVGLGLWVRLKLAETPAFQAAMSQAPPPQAPLLEMLRRHPLSLAGGSVAMVAVFAIFYIVTAFALGYGVNTLHFGRQATLTVQLVSILFFALGIAIAGWWCDRATPRIVMLAGYGSLALSGLLLPALMGSHHILVFGAFICLAMFLMGFISGPQGSFLPGLFPTRVRYSGAAISFSAGGILGGGMAPMIATALAAKGSLAPVAVYYSATAVISFVSVLLLRRAADRHLG